MRTLSYWLSMPAKDPLTKEIQESQANYLKQVRSWTDISHRAYLNSQAAE